jgi:ATP/maltotriose-dependent transcriptional regulator MalT
MYFRWHQMKSSDTRVNDQWPLVGRTAELARLRRLLEDDQCGGVVLAGEAGVGKTRLAIECGAMAQQLGAVVARTTATRSASSIPFGAVTALLPTDDTSAPGGEGIDQSELLRRLISGLMVRADSGQMVLIIDDAHYLDPASATLIHRIVETRSAFVVVVVRTGALAPDALVSLWKDGSLERLAVEPLDTEAVREVLESVLGAPVTAATVTLLVDRCRGNALFLRELVLGAFEDGTLHTEQGIWQLTENPTPSARLVEIVENRVGALNFAQREVLEFLAIGDPLGRIELETLLDREAVSTLENQNLIESRLDGRRLQLHLAHPLYGDLLRARMPAIRVAEISRALADVVEGVGARRRDDALRIGAWRLAGGGGTPALMYGAAVAAHHRFDIELADDLARYAVRAGAGFDAALLVAHLAGLRGRNSEANDRLSALAAEAADDHQRCRVAISRLDIAHMQLLRDTYRQIADEALQAIGEPRSRKLIAAHGAWNAFTAEGPRATAELLKPLLADGDVHLLATAALPAANAFSRLGRLGEALEVIDAAEEAQSADALVEFGTPLEWSPWAHAMARSEILVRAGRFDEARDCTEGRYQSALASHWLLAQAYMAWALAHATVERGHVRTATRFAREATALFHQFDLPLAEKYALVDLTQAATLLGDVDGARDALRRIDALPGHDMSLVPRLLHVRGWSEVLAGDVPKARRLWQKAADEGERIGDLVEAIAALHSMARIGYPKDAVQAMKNLAAGAEGELIPIRVDHVVALVAGDAAELEEIAERFQVLGADLLAAEAAADAAAAWIRAGDSRRSASAVRLSTDSLRYCEGAVSPALQSVRTRVRLTPAERETAMLAAQGRSNKEIADDLVVSVRTIESRLQSVYVKLGIANREQISSVL